VWQDNIALFEDTVEKSPDFAEANNELSILYRKAGRVQEYLAIQGQLDLRESQLASLNKIMIIARLGNPKGARELMIDRLETSGRHKATVIEQILKVTDMMIAESQDEEVKNSLLREKVDWLKLLYETTGAPFYNYRLGNLSLQLDDKEAAYRYFKAAAEEFPESSLYKKPAQKIADQLGKQ
jgi:tetratricopeptide (TPR) repeat protein